MFTRQPQAMRSGFTPHGLHPVLVFSAFAAFGAASANAESMAAAWPQWRGPSRDGKLTNAAEWPTDLSSLNRRWRVDLGPGYSGPIVWGDRVFVTETVDEKDEVVRALDRSTGREIWKAQWTGAISVPFFARRNGDWIRATPACDGESLFVAGIRDVLVCLNIRTGEERWRVDFPDKLKTAVPAFGYVSSPLVIGDHVYVQAGAGFVKLDKRSGSIVWHVLKDDGGMNSAFSSPVEATICGVNQLVVQTRRRLVGVVPESGAILWSQDVPAFRGMNILTPTIYNDGVFTSTYKNRSFFYKLQKSDGAMQSTESWNSKPQGYMSSPVIIDHHAYLHLGNGRMSCIDLRTGKQSWRSKSFGDYWSLVANRDRILALDERGELLLFAADPAEFRLIDRKPCADSESWAHLAVCGNDVFVRDLSGISAFDWK